MQHYIGNELELFKVAQNWKTYYSRHFKRLLKGEVLEVGPGIGETTYSLCDGSQTSWLCVEPDKELADEINQKVQSGYLPSFIEVLVETIESINQRKFDTIIYIDVIEHIENDADELRKAALLLKPGGHLIILVPAHNYLFSEFDKSIGHFRRYNKAMLADVVPDGLKQVRLRYLDSVGLFASLANKWFLKQPYPKVKHIKFWDNFMIPLSRVIDPILMHSIGKTVVGVWQKPL